MLTGEPWGVYFRDVGKIVRAKKALRCIAIGMDFVIVLDVDVMLWRFGDVIQRNMA